MIVPQEFDQTQLGYIINKCVRGENDNNDTEKVKKIINAFSDSDVKTVILACTDLQLLQLVHPKVTIYDSMKILADAITEEILKL
ncbi:hypothetical protein A3C26_03190 [Candidatus Daviesbacteria bacterium RIFCSPHIGHO2_02_FULL_39_12]|uniref:Aspartate racemase n=2 Tax=Candidatus Daviesiibacteriota TaxID=1752718 RepID=A0A1F5JDT9_9BACT|nr:MAG: hypothetical protein A3C26_03190 [Candidatus Daviesbacteria bacterium RIFCSPHIGHO2_02_FULL_39_12]OGE71889.1 MAG: hypothetical protein A3H40_03345 [Candidatus Daviesbacteria bacterium RIFCSPLOWO2_02_FULL_38_15]